MRKIHGAMVAVVAMTMAVLVGAACSGSSGSKAGTFGDTECASCIETACSTELSACTALGDCNDALECILDCPIDDNALDVDCAQNDCGELVTTSAGGTALSAVVSCYLDESPSAGSCGAQCAPSTE